MAISSELDAVLRTVSANKDIKPVLAVKDPLLEFFEHEGDAGAKPVCTVENTLSAGASSNAAIALANAGLVGDIGFNLTYRRDFAMLKIDDIDVDAGMDDAALVDTITRQDNKADETLAFRCARNVYRDGTGLVGQLAAASAISGADFTLATAGDARGFYKGQKLVFAATLGGAPRAGTVTVATVNRATGVVTCTGNVTAGISAAANGDFVFVEGDQSSTLLGLGGLMPETVLGSLYGIDRTIYPREYVAGTFSNQSANPGDIYTKLGDGLDEIDSASGHTIEDGGLLVVPNSKKTALSRALTAVELHSAMQDRERTQAGHIKMYMSFANGVTPQVVRSYHIPQDRALYVPPNCIEMLTLHKEMFGYIKPGTDGPIWKLENGDQHVAAKKSYMVLNFPGIARCGWIQLD